MDSTLTALEVAVLSDQYNLADGHAYRPWSPAELQIVDALPRKLRHVDRRDHQRVEEAYFETFFTLARQTLHGTGWERFPCSTASTAIEIIANYLRLNGLSVTLIEPCFDNLKDILRRHDVPLSVFPDRLLDDDGETLDTFLETVSTDVLFLVSPNNPTGRVLREDNFQRIVEHCARRGTMLVLDSCFRFYVPPDLTFDQYATLDEAGIDCIIIEDTGKTWPTAELKAPFMSVSKHLIDPIARINSDFILHVPPVVVALLTDFLKLSIQDERGGILTVVAQNRAALYAELAGSLLHPIEQPFMSMSWLRIESPMPAPAVSRLLGQNGIHVLPGNQFFWSDESLGDPFLRVALVRDPVMFAQAAAKLAQVCRDLPIHTQPGQPVQFVVLP